jgi:hypothetical protein
MERISGIVNWLVEGYIPETKIIVVCGREVIVEGKCGELRSAVESCCLIYMIRGERGGPKVTLRAYERDPLARIPISSATHA